VRYESAIAPPLRGYGAFGGTTITVQTPTGPLAIDPNVVSQDASGNYVYNGPTGPITIPASVIQSIPGFNTPPPATSVPPPPATDQANTVVAIVAVAAIVGLSALLLVGSR